MIPPIDEFRKMVRQFRGNLSRLADSYGVSRCTVEKWKNHDEEYKQAVRDARMRLFDNCLQTSEVLAMGIPVKDEDGKIIGWEEKPDGNMLRYLMGKLGASEGFGEGQEQSQGDEMREEDKEIGGISINVTYNEKEHLDLQGKREEIEESSE